MVQKWPKNDPKMAKNGPKMAKKFTWVPSKMPKNQKNRKNAKNDPAEPRVIALSKSKNV